MLVLISVVQADSNGFQDLFNDRLELAAQDTHQYNALIFSMSASVSDLQRVVLILECCA